MGEEIEMTRKVSPARSIPSFSLREKARMSALGLARCARDARQIRRAMRTAGRLDRDRHSAGRAILHSRWTCFRALEAVYPFNKEKNTKRDDDEVDRDGNEIAVGKHWPEFLCISQRHPGRDVIGQAKVKIAEIQIADGPADGRHQQVFDDGADNFSKGGADDYPDREIDRVTFDGKFFEFFPHAIMSS